MKGLYHKYNVTKADGSPVDPDAYYLVLRLDAGEYRDACRAGARSFAKAVEAHNPQLAADILDTLPELEDELEASRARVAELEAKLSIAWNLAHDLLYAVEEGEEE